MNQPPNHKLQPQTLRLPSPVWRTLFDESGEVLAIETRDAATRAAAFKVLHLPNFKPVSLQVHASLDIQATYIGMEALTHGVLLIHGYADPNRPGHIGLWAYQCSDGRLLWQGPHLRFVRVLPDGLLCTDTKSILQPRLLLDPKTGEHIRTVKPGESQYLDQQRQSYAQGMEHVGTFAAVHNEAAPEFEQCSARIQSLSGKRCRLQIDSLTIGSVEIYSYYEPTQAGYALHLLVAQGQCVMYEDVLLAETKLLSFDPFFVLGSRLVYVREREELCVLMLPK